MRRKAGKRVVRIHVGQQQNDQRNRPGNTDERTGNQFGKPGDDAVFCQRAGQADQATHPDQGIPGTFFGQNVFPVDRFADQHDADSQHGDDGGVDFGDAAGSPEDQRQHEHAADDLFAA